MQPHHPGAEGGPRFLQATEAEHHRQIPGHRDTADGFYALRVMKETGGSGDDVTDDEIREGIRLLAECEGIFAETAGGGPSGYQEADRVRKIASDSSAVLCITGNGLKTLDAVVGHVGQPRDIKPSLREFEALLSRENPELVTA